MVSRRQMHWWNEKRWAGKAVIWFNCATDPVRMWGWATWCIVLQFYRKQLEISLISADADGNLLSWVLELQAVTQMDSIFSFHYHVLMLNAFVTCRFDWIFINICYLVFKLGQSLSSEDKFTVIACKSCKYTFAFSTVFTDFHKAFKELPLLWLPAPWLQLGC